MSNKTSSAVANARGPSSGMPALGIQTIRPGGPRGMAAPGQAVRPRGGASFNTAGMPLSNVAPRAMFRPIGSFNVRPSFNATPIQDQSETSPKDED